MTQMLELADKDCKILFINICKDPVVLGESNRKGGLHS